MLDREAGTPEGLVCDEGHDHRGHAGGDSGVHRADSAVVDRGSHPRQDGAVVDGFAHEHIGSDHIGVDGETAESGGDEHATPEVPRGIDDRAATLGRTRCRHRSEAGVDHVACVEELGDFGIVGGRRR